MAATFVWPFLPSASSSKEPLQKLAAPPLYAAEVPARASQLTPTGKQQFNKALDLCEQIQGALSQSQSEHYEVVDERPPECKEEDGATNLEALASQVQALTTAQQTQQQVNAQLQLEKEQLEQRLHLALGQLQQSLRNGGAAGTVPQRGELRRRK